MARPSSNSSSKLCRRALLAAILATSAPAAATAPCAAAPLPAGTAHPAAWPAGRNGVLIDPKAEQFIDKVMAGMTVEEKVGQLVQADIASVTPDEAKRYHLGSILAGGNAAPGGDIRTGPKAWLDLVDAFQKAALSAPADHHPPIPIIFGIDAVHGDAKVRGATIFPHNVGLGAAHDPALLQQVGRATAQEVSATGVDWTFAPTVAVARDVRWGRSYESYSDDPALVAQYSAAMVTGLQGRLGSADFLAPGHTLSSVKHFLGDGGTLDGRDQGDNRASEAVLRDVHAAGYPPAIEAGAAIVMASYNGWQGVKMHANQSLLTDVLKGRMGFDGFVVGDWNAQEEIPGCTKFSCPQAINAGIDMIMAPDSWRQFYENTLDQVRRGVIPQSRLDDAVRRILRVKVLAGLFDRPSAAARPNAGDFSAFGGAEHRALARQAVRESLVLLKNQGGLLPLRPQANILVAGEAADDIGQQAGGWTVDWQGAHNTNADFPGATSIWSGIRAAVEAAGGTATLSPDGRYSQRPDAAVVVFGEKPYAEFVGDRETVEFSPNDKSALALLRRLKAQHIPVVAVFLSGRPLWVNPELNAADAFVAAWLPGSEGEGVADVLFRRPDGKVGQDFKGRLSFNWPATGMPVRYPETGTPTGVLFPRGYGLDYESHHALARLSETSQVPPERRVRNSFFHAGHVTAPWSIYVADPDAEVRLTMVDQSSPAGDLDTRHEGSAIRAAWGGGKAAVWRIGGGGGTVDLTQAAKAGQGLLISYRVVGAATGPVTLSQACGANCAGAVDVTKALSARTPGWVKLNIPLSCFAKAGADLSRIEDPVVLKTQGKLDLLIREARLTPASETACPGG